MRKWMRDRLRRRKRKGAPSDSEQTGKVGQEKEAPERGNPPPIQPSYLDAFEKERKSAAVSRGEQKFEVETQPETPATPPVAAAGAMGAQPSKKPKGVVILAIGLPGSGKTTWFKRRGVTPLSSDLLRTMLFDDIEEQRYQGLVFSTLRSLLRARLVARMPWNYVDATNLSPKERKQWIHMARGFGYEVQAVFFDVPIDVCLERNRRRERVVPEDVMRRMAAKLKPPSFSEGFNKIVVVRVKQKGEEAQ